MELCASVGFSSGSASSRVFADSRMCFGGRGALEFADSRMCVGGCGALEVED